MIIFFEDGPLLYSAGQDFLRYMDLEQNHWVGVQTHYFILDILGLALEIDMIENFMFLILVHVSTVK